MSLKKNKTTLENILIKNITKLKKIQCDAHVADLTKKQIKSFSLAQLKKCNQDAIHHLKIAQVTMDHPFYIVGTPVHDRAKHIHMLKNKMETWTHFHLEDFLSGLKKPPSLTTKKRPRKEIVGRGEDSESDEEDEEEDEEISDEEDNDKRFQGQAYKLAAKTTPVIAKELETLEHADGVSEGEKNLIREEFVKADADFHDFYSKSNMSHKDVILVSSLARVFKRELGLQLKENLNDLVNQHLTAQTKKDESKKAQSSFMWNMLSKVWDGIKMFAGMLKKLLNWGFNLLTFILAHPRTAKILSFIALKYKKQLCKEIRICFEIEKYQEPTTMGTLESAGEYIRQAVPGAISEYVKSSKFDSAWDVISSTATAGITGLISTVPYLASAVPVVGVLVTSVMEVTKEASRFGIEIAMYEADILSTTSQLIQLLDISDCLKPETSGHKVNILQPTTQPVVEEALKKTSENNSKSTNGGSGWLSTLFT